MKSIELTQGKATFVDDDVYGWASKFKWFAVKDEHRWYATRNVYCLGTKTQTRVMLHREILQLGTGDLKVDHKDGDGLNNLRENLRLATNAQNGQNRRRPKTNSTSKFLGVRRRDYSRWEARITVEGKLHSLGSFKREEEAARAYDEAARKFFREFASPNFI